MRVLPAVAGHVRFEHGTPEQFGTPERAAVLVHYAKHRMLTRSVAALADALTGSGYRTVLVSAAEVDGPLRWPDHPREDVLVLRKPNVGYDFGSWAVALDTLPAIAGAERVILTNDSMAGPFAPLGPLIERMESSAADVIGMTDTRQFAPHLQSYFLSFRGGVLAEPPLRRFFAGVRHERSKWQIIKRYEIGLAEVLRRAGYGVTSAFHATSVVEPDENPVIIGWAQLLERGFPFVKRQILRYPFVAPAGDQVPWVVRNTYGERIEEWV